MTGKQNAPEIRFEGFADPWEQRKFSDLVLIERGGSPRPIDAYITEDPAGLNWVKIGDAPSMGRYIASTSEKIKLEGLSKTRQVYPGDLVLSNSMSFGRPYIMAVEGCIHDGWLLIRDTQNQFDPVFLCHMLGTPQMLDQYRMFASGSTVNNLNKELVGNAMVPLPNRDEQVKIGKYLDELDGLITLHQRKYDKLCTVKKSMLDKMFPKPGETEPEIRFEGFTDPWEQRKLGELCTISKGHGYSKADIRDAGTPLILYGRLYTQYESRIENVDTFAVEQEGSLLSKGNEVIVPASGETAEDIAVASSVRRSGIIFGGDLNVVTPVNKLDPDYIALAITYSKAHDDLAKRAQGKSVVHVHGNDIAEVEIPYPSKSEQKRISTVVLGLDSLITLHQRKLELLRNIKKSLLDRMFV